MGLVSGMAFPTHWRLASVAIATLLGRPSGAQSATVPQADVVVVGCYRLSLGPWSSASGLGPARPTTVFRLDTVPRRPGVPGDLVAERIEPAEFALPGDVRARFQQPARWRREGGDSVVIIPWLTGTEAEAFYGRWAGGSLHGVIRRTSDAIPVDPLTRRIQWDAWPWATASAVPVPCP
jgi:hypothetical protein